MNPEWNERLRGCGRREGDRNGPKSRAGGCGRNSQLTESPNDPAPCSGPPHTESPKVAPAPHKEDAPIANDEADEPGLGRTLGLVGPERRPSQAGIRGDFAR